jgi:hypothetical protein
MGRPSGCFRARAEKKRNCTERGARRSGHLKPKRYGERLAVGLESDPTAQGRLPQLDGSRERAGLGDGKAQGGHLR